MISPPMYRFRILLLALVGVVAVVSGILLAIFSATIQMSLDNASLGGVAYRCGNLIAIVGLCLLIVAYLEYRRKQKSDK